MTTSSGESSSDKEPAPTPRKATKRKERAAVPKVPFSRLSPTQAQLTKDAKQTQAVQAARMRKLRSSGPADAPVVIPSIRKHKSSSASPSSAEDSYDSGVVPSSDSNASLDLATNTG